MIASLLDPRAEIYAALAGAGIGTAESAGERVPVPGVIVAPGSPWITASGLLDRDIRRSTWSVLAVAGRSDAEGTLGDLDDLLRACWGALRPMLGGPGAWTVPQIDAPSIVTVNGADHVGAQMLLTRIITLAEV